MDYSENHLREMANKIGTGNNIPQEDIEPFIWFYMRNMRPDENDGELNNEDFKSWENFLIRNSNKFIDGYKKTLLFDHSDEWAKEFANWIALGDDEYDAMNNAYRFIRKKYNCSYSQKENNGV
ncbi:MAG TPA: hypothetical protein VN958_13375, partial [Chitinophagaceae bacterium]|nr:hypothetical protein [Chitinophagaceae bacterium]